MADKKRQLKFGAFMYTPGLNATGWRHPDAVPSTDMKFERYLHMARVAERGKLDMMFLQDSSAVPGTAGLGGRNPLRPVLGRQVHLEPVSLIAALAPMTRNIGLVATATTTYNEPYNIARRFATIDHISAGRAGWNLVTSQIEDEAGNFGLERHVSHAERYDRAMEFYDVVAGLWDSWDDDAFIHDKDAGLYYDADKVHFLEHRGKHFAVRGPLNVSRAPQGHPVVAQAGSSEVGKELAAKSADIVFTAQTTRAAARAFYADVKGRMARYHRAHDDMKILPGLMPIVGQTNSEAQEKFDELQDLLPDEVALHSLSRLTGDLDIGQYDLDGPLPELPPSNAAQGRQKLLIDLARRENMTIRQVARHLAQAGGGHQYVIGSPSTIADVMEDWLVSYAADGFNLLFPHYPKPLEEFVEMVVPELQRRGLFRTDYEGPTLREVLGVPFPRSRFARS